MKDSEGLVPVDPNITARHWVRSTKSYLSPSSLVWSDTGEEDMGGLMPHAIKNARSEVVKESLQV